MRAALCAAPNLRPLWPPVTAATSATRRDRGSAAAQWAPRLAASEAVQNSLQGPLPNRPRETKASATGGEKGFEKRQVRLENKMAKRTKKIKYMTIWGINAVPEGATGSAAQLCKSDRPAPIGPLTIFGPSPARIG